MPMCQQRNAIALGLATAAILSACAAHAREIRIDVDRATGRAVAVEHLAMPDVRRSCDAGRDAGVVGAVRRGRNGLIGELELRSDRQGTQVFKISTASLDAPAAMRRKVEARLAEVLTRGGRVRIASFACGRGGKEKFLEAATIDADPHAADARIQQRTASAERDNQPAAANEEPGRAPVPQEERQAAARPASPQSEEAAVWRASSPFAAMNVLELRSTGGEARMIVHCVFSGDKPAKFGILIEGPPRWDVVSRQGRLAIDFVRQNVTFAASNDFAVVSDVVEDGVVAVSRELLDRLALGRRLTVAGRMAGGPTRAIAFDVKESRPILASFDRQCALRQALR
jgi:hypothetical protein